MLDFAVRFFLVHGEENWLSVCSYVVQSHSVVVKEKAKLLIY